MLSPPVVKLRVRVPIVSAMQNSPAHSPSCNLAIYSFLEWESLRGQHKLFFSNSKFKLSSICLMRCLGTVTSLTVVKLQLRVLLISATATSGHNWSPPSTPLLATLQSTHFWNGDHCQDSINCSIVMRSVLTRTPSGRRR